MADKSILIKSMEGANLSLRFYQSDINRATSFYESKAISYVYSPNNEEAIFVINNEANVHFSMKRSMVTYECDCGKTNQCKHIIACFIYVKKNPIIIGNLCAIPDITITGNVNKLEAYYNKISRLTGPFTCLNSFVKDDVLNCIKLSIDMILELLKQSNELNNYINVFKLLDLYGKMISYPELASYEQSFIAIIDKLLNSEYNNDTVNEAFYNMISSSNKKGIINLLNIYCLDNKMNKNMYSIIEKAIEYIDKSSSDKNSMIGLYDIKASYLLTSENTQDFLDFAVDHQESSKIRIMLYRFFEKVKNYQMIVNIWRKYIDMNEIEYYLRALAKIDKEVLDIEILTYLQPKPTLDFIQMLKKNDLLDENIVSCIIDLTNKNCKFEDKISIFDLIGKKDEINKERYKKGIEEINKNFSFYIEDDFFKLIAFYQEKIYESVKKNGKFSNVVKYLNTLCTNEYGKFYAYDITKKIIDDLHLDYYEMNRAVSYLSKVLTR